MRSSIAIRQHSNLFEALSLFLSFMVYQQSGKFISKTWEQNGTFL